jgi:hypothetical protein
MRNETATTKWAATKTHVGFRLYRAIPGQAYMLIATVGNNGLGWKAIPQNTIGKPSRKRWTTAEEAVWQKYGTDACNAIRNPSKPGEL